MSETRTSLVQPIGPPVASYPRLPAHWTRLEARHTDPH